MDEPSAMKRLCDGYIRHAGLVGALYAIVPVLIWFGLCLALIPFRQVYLLRMLLALVVGGAMGAWLNRFGLELWLLKHRSGQEPATILDGALIGAAIGVGIALLPPLTALIYTEHPVEALTFIIAAWLASCLIGGCIGALLASVGRQHVERK